MRLPSVSCWKEHGIWNSPQLGFFRNRICQEDGSVGDLLGSEFEINTHGREGKKGGGRTKLCSAAASLETSADNEGHSYNGMAFPSCLQIAEKTSLYMPTSINVQMWVTLEEVKLGERIDSNFCFVFCLLFKLGSLKFPYTMKKCYINWDSRRETLANRQVSFNAVALRLHTLEGSCCIACFPGAHSLWYSSYECYPGERCSLNLCSELPVQLYAVP